MNMRDYTGEIPDEITALRSALAAETKRRESENADGMMWMGLANRYAEALRHLASYEPSEHVASCELYECETCLDIIAIARAALGQGEK